MAEEPAADGGGAGGEASGSRREEGGPGGAPSPETRPPPESGELAPVSGSGEGLTVSGVLRGLSRRRKRPSIFESDRPGWEFIQRLPGKKIAIWAGFVGLLVLLRDFFDVIVVTFVLAYITSHVVAIVEARTGYRRLSVVGVYLVLIGVLTLLGFLALPNLFAEGKDLWRQAALVSKDEFHSMPLYTALTSGEDPGAFEALDEAEVKVTFVAGANEGQSGTISAVEAPGHIWLAEPMHKPIQEGDQFVLSTSGENAVPFFVTKRVANFDLNEKLMEALGNLFGEERLAELRGYYEGSEAQIQVEKAIGEALEKVGGAVRAVLNAMLTIAFHFLMSLLFSFMIVLWLPGLRRKVVTLSQSRFGDVYDEVAPSLLTFGRLLGRAFEAQTMIALVNTLLTFIGMWILGIEGKMFLSLVVFACSFIPVLGVFISTIPIALIALKDSGVGLMLATIGMVVIVHAVEAYVLNPYIYGAHLSLHPLAVLIILVTAEHIFGLWGLVLGVPLSAYFYEHVIWEGQRPGAPGRGGPAPPRDGSAPEESAPGAAAPAPVAS